MSAFASRRSAKPGNGLPRRGVVSGCLLAVSVFNAVSALGGGVGLLTPGSMGIPLSSIDSTGLTSFVWPAVVLIAVVGGTQMLAVAAGWRRSPLTPLVGALAGFTMVIWIFVELAIMGDYSVLHGLYFASGIAQLTLVCLVLGVVPRLVSRSCDGSR